MSADGSGWFRRMSDCIGKEPFSTPQLARKVQRRRSRKAGDRRRQVVYHCRFCGQFHIGTNSKSRQPAPADRKRWRFVAMEESDA